MDPETQRMCEQFAEEAAAVARRSPEDREAWLAWIAGLLKDEPRREEFLGDVRNVMRAALAADEALLKSRYAGEIAEAKLVDLIDHLCADASREMPPDRCEALRIMAFVAVAGHVTPIVGERLAQPDAQALLQHWLGHTLKNPARPPASAEESG